MLSRRQLLSGAGAGLLAGLASHVISRSAGAKTAGTFAKGPRYWLCVVPSGGMDAIYTTDPRTSTEVAAGVDVPYEPHEIVEAGGLRLGPLFKGLAPWSSRLSVIKGVAVNTANHQTGLLQAARIKTSTSNWTPSALEIIGAHRDGQAVGYMSLNAPYANAYTPYDFGEPFKAAYGPPTTSLFALIDSLSREELETAGRVMGDNAASLMRRGPMSVADEEARSAAAQSSAFLRRAAIVPPFKVEPWVSGPAGDAEETARMAVSLQRALWTFEHDLVATATVFSDVAWDSHTRNAKIQTQMTPYLVTVLDRLFTELDRRSNAHGRLSDQTAVLVFSELGRLPYLNQAKGKDHFPQTSVLTFGKWFRGGATFGAAGKQLEGLGVSTKTGKQDPATSQPLLLDDIGATALHLAGIDPEKHGFAGRRLDFLVGA
jgi:uncharacterized protein (DUF1501 family)